MNPQHGHNIQVNETPSQSDVEGSKIADQTTHLTKKNQQSMTTLNAP